LYLWESQKPGQKPVDPGVLLEDRAPKFLRSNADGRTQRVVPRRYPVHPADQELVKPTIDKSCTPSALPVGCSACEASKSWWKSARVWSWLLRDWLPDLCASLASVAVARGPAVGRAERLRAKVEVVPDSHKSPSVMVV
jgi:hypothetical protein